MKKKVNHVSYGITVALVTFLSGLSNPALAQRIELSEPTTLRARTTQDLRTYSSGIALHKDKKVGAGFMVSGPIGLAGAHLQFNFAQDVGISLGYGGSQDFKAFNVNVRQLMGGRAFMPYVVGGYSRWWSGGGGRLSSTTPGFLGEKFLSENAQETGIFTEHFIYPGLGIQYYTLGGPRAGLSFYAELDLLISTKSLIVQPVGALGTAYYF